MRVVFFYGDAMGKKIEVKAGDRFNSWTVIREVEKRGKHRYFLCKCTCGKKIEVRLYDLIDGKSSKCKSCASKGTHNSIIHGLSKHPLYKVWKGIISRCFTQSATGYYRYGGKGITVCSEWRNDFKIFYDWAISHNWEKRLSIDRINNDGNYEPSNCRFVTCRENNLNQRLIRADNASGFRGVSFNKKIKKWQAYISVKNKLYYLGYHNTVKEAVQARNKFIIDNELEHEYEIQPVSTACHSCTYSCITTSCF